VALSMEELEQRLSAVEAKVERFGADAAAVRILAGGADRDVSALAARLDAQTQLLQALRETQVEQGRTLAEQGRDIAELKTSLADTRSEMRQGFTEMRGKLDATAAGLDQITALVTRLLGPETDQ
jgi:chromosome segregation ATPase